MPYLNLDLNYFENPKTLRLVGLLGKGAEVLPIKLWCYCGKHHTESGKLTGYSAQEIEAILGWWGDNGKMVDAMVKVGMLEQKNDEYVLHDWIEHEGHLVAFKKRAKQAARKRWGKLSSNATSIAKRHLKQCPSLTSLTSLTKPNLTIKSLSAPQSKSEPAYADFERKTIEGWNQFCKKHPLVAEVKDITDSRRIKLKKRYQDALFKNFEAILQSAEEQPFLLNGSDSQDHKNWRMSFDWLIANDTNYIKVLEKKYLDKRKENYDFLGNR